MKLPIGPSSPANCGITGGADPAVRIPSPGGWEREAIAEARRGATLDRQRMELISCEGYARAGKIAAPGRFFVPGWIRRDGSGRASCKPVPGSGPQRPAPGAPGTRGRERQAHDGRRRNHRGPHVRRRPGRIHPPHRFRVQLFLVSFDSSWISPAMMPRSARRACFSSGSSVLRPGRRFAHARYLIFSFACLMRVVP